MASQDEARFAFTPGASYDDVRKEPINIDDFYLVMT